MSLRLRAVALALFAGAGVTRISRAARGARGASIDRSKIVDLTYTFDAHTIYWPTEPPFVRQVEHFGPQPGGWFYAAGTYAAHEHGGTHMDAPVHFNRAGLTIDKVPLTQLIGPAAVIDFSPRAARDRDATLNLDDLDRWEAAHGPLPDGAIVVARSGWGRFWPDRERYLGTAQPGDAAHLRFPGFALEAVDYLLTRRNVAALAIDTASIDPGVATDFAVHRRWLGANRPGFENVANAEQLPAAGATIFCIPMKIGEGSGAPARIFALLP
ncbi:MAG TPA: cyclase family protein [Candidatus Binataceae bacterium]|nr:cyclase family protein [Candidatus Binataceae bacterium]